MTRLAVIGAGLSGLVVARQLQTIADVTVFEKSRGAGGRMATRYAGDFEFDHGAQFFTARTAAFQAFLRPLIEEGVVADWPAQFAEFDRSNMTTTRSWSNEYPHYVGVPRMNSIGKALSAGLNITFDTMITEITRSSDGWTLSDHAGTQSEPFDWLVLALPSAQTATLAKAFPDLFAYCGERSMLGCFALMLGFAEPIDLPWQAAMVRNADVSWISVNSSKPGRKSPFALVVHSTNRWAEAHLDDDFDVVLRHMLDEASQIAGRDLRRAGHRQLHRWRYANIAGQPGPTYFVNDDKNIVACGDWCVRGRIEAAFVSANDLSEALSQRI